MHKDATSAKAGRQVQGEPSEALSEALPKRGRGVSRGGVERERHAAAADAAANRSTEGDGKAPGLFLIHERKASVDLDAETSLPERLGKYANAKRYSRYVADWVCEKEQKTACTPTRVLAEWRVRARQQLGCAGWLHFRKAIQGDDTAWRLHNALFCQQGHTCPLCALRRGAKSVQAIVPRVLTVLQEHPNWEAYFVTLTIENSPDLAETFDVLDGGLKALVRQCRQAKTKPEESRAMRAVAGGVGHIETKRGRGGAWHPHYHGLWLCDRRRMANPRARFPIDTSALLDAWRNATNGRGQWIKVLPLGAELLRRRGSASVEQFTAQLRNDVCEVVKYAVKFEDVLGKPMSNDARDQKIRDLWTAADVLRGRTLLRSFGQLHGVKVDEDLRDDPLDWETMQYIDRFFRYRQGEYKETLMPSTVPGRGVSSEEGE